MKLIDPDMTKYKLVVPSGVTYYFAEASHLTEALIEGGGDKFVRHAAYVIKDGKFLKNRSLGIQIPNSLLDAGRDKVNEFFDFMEKV